MKCIVRNNNGKYLTPRRPTGTLYRNRTGWSRKIDDAKVFNTTTSAKNSANQAPEVSSYEVLTVHIVVQHP